MTMSNMHEKSFGSRRAIRRNALILVMSSLACYVISGILIAKAGPAAGFAPLAIALGADLFALTIWLVFRNHGGTTRDEK
ncbi:hypothetical protein ABZ929_16590 [Streptomyces physcomitrii]|uniref:hypothetical protein n=1 Tax=Streptomyces physcomitrii TaxID=2724184 RepID=UPI0033D29293